MNIELVVFDMAGTTVHDAGGVNACLRDALARAGLSADVQAVNQVMGLPKREALAKLIKRSGLRHALLPRLDEIHDDFVTAAIRYYATDPSIREVAGAGRTFATLKQAGIKVALNTGFSRDIAQVILNRLGWLDGAVIDFSVTSDEVKRGRPYPDMIQLLMARAGIREPTQVAKVGDTPADLQEGHNAGCGLVIGVTQGTHRRAELECFPHTHLIATVADLPSVLNV
jgi:phosphonatase-like hydrolase